MNIPVGVRLYIAQLAHLMYVNEFNKVQKLLPNEWARYGRVGCQCWRIVHGWECGNSCNFQCGAYHPRGCEAGVCRYERTFYQCYECTHTELQGHVAFRFDT